MNHKQMLADFYLKLLAMSKPLPSHLLILELTVNASLAVELGETPETIKRIFLKMAAEDAKI